MPTPPYGRRTVLLERVMPAVRRILTALVTGTLAAAGALAAATTASAHDQLLSSSPADGEVVTSAPTALTLQFSADVVDLSTTVVLRLPDGTAREDLAVTVAGPTVTAALPDDLVSGAYAVAWRVVSADGHPIEGAFAYTVEDPTRPAGGATPTPTPTAPAVTASETPTEQPDAAAPSATATLTAASPATEPDDSSAPWAVFGLVLAAGASVVVLLVRRRRRSAP